MKRILITGVTGFVGSNLVKHFSTLPAYSVIGHSRDVEKAKEQFRSNKLEVVAEYSASILDQLKIDYVIHLAGIAHDLSNQYKPDDYYKVNYEDTKLTYDEFLKSKASKFIFVSSIKAAVDIAHEPITEEVIPNPVTDYGKSKWKAEQYIQSQSIAAGKYFYILRPAMIHGPGNKGNLNLLYRFVKSGVPFPFGAFDNKRSFLSIENFSFIVQQLLSGEFVPGVYHLADHGFLSTKELYKVIANSLGKRSRVLHIPKSWILTLADIFGKKHLVNKLTEDMMVSNKKILNQLQVQLPVNLTVGISKTIKSFDA
jgi:nucleoside-diphosphate-sugar epimerase